MLQNKCYKIYGLNLEQIRLVELRCFQNNKSKVDVSEQ